MLEEFSKLKLESTRTTDRRNGRVLTVNALTCFDITLVKESWFDEATDEAPELLVEFLF